MSMRHPEDQRIFERLDLTPEEIAFIEGDDETPTPPTTKEQDMPKPFRQPIHPGASREEKLAALPAYPLSVHGKAMEKRLAEIRDTAHNTLTELDGLLDDVAEKFNEAFARDDARAAAHDRIAATAKAHRDAQRRI